MSDFFLLDRYLEQIRTRRESGNRIQNSSKNTKPEVNATQLIACVCTQLSSTPIFRSHQKSRVTEQLNLTERVHWSTERREKNQCEEKENREDIRSEEERRGSKSTVEGMCRGEYIGRKNKMNERDWVNQVPREACSTGNKTRFVTDARQNACGNELITDDGQYFFTKELKF